MRPNNPLAHFKALTNFSKDESIYSIIGKAAARQEEEIRNTSKEIFFQKLEIFCKENNVDSNILMKHCFNHVRPMLQLMFSLDPVPHDEYMAFFTAITKGYKL